MSNFIRITVASSYSFTLAINYIFAGLVPFKFFWLLSNTNPHALTVQWSWLGEIANVQFNSFATKVTWTRVVAHTKIKPLMVSSSVRVNSHVQVVFKWFYFKHLVQIATFKHGIKSELIVTNKLGVHSCERSWLFWWRLFVWLGYNRKVEFVWRYRIEISFIFIWELLMHLYWSCISRP